MPSRTGQLWAVAPDGSGLAQLTSPAGGVALAAHPAWSPDGRRVAFSGRSAAGDFNIWTVRADGGGLARLTNFSAPHYAMVPAWSPDGGRVVFESNLLVPRESSTAGDATEVWAGRASGAARAVRHACEGRGAAACCSLGAPCCARPPSPVCPPPPPARDTPPPHPQVFSVLAATGGDRVRLTTTPGSGRSSFGGKLSPDGRWLAFASDRGPGQPAGLYDLYVAAADGAGPRRLTRGAANQLSRSWSPDSRQIAFNTQARQRLAGGVLHPRLHVRAYALPAGRLRQTAAPSPPSPRTHPRSTTGCATASASAASASSGATGAGCVSSRGRAGPGLRSRRVRPSPPFAAT